MSTRCLIGFYDMEADNVIYAYCHAGGYPEVVGNILVNHYSTPKLVKELISLKGFSFLANTTEETSKYTYDDIKEQMSMSYSDYRTTNTMGIAYIYTYYCNSDKNSGSWTIRSCINYDLESCLGEERSMDYKKHIDITYNLFKGAGHYLVDVPKKKAGEVARGAAILDVYTLVFANHSKYRKAIYDVIPDLDDGYCALNAYTYGAIQLADKFGTEDFHECYADWVVDVIKPALLQLVLEELKGEIENESNI